MIRLGRSMAVLLSGILLFHAGWYLIFPFFAVLFTSRRGLTPGQAGLLLAVQSFTLLAGSLLGGWLADRLGRKRTLLVGLLLRAAGLWGLGLALQLPALLLSAAIAGTGGGIYGPPAKAGIAALATGENQATAFAARGIAANIGVSLGPLLGSLLIKGTLPTLFSTAAALHAALALLTWALYQEQRPTTPAKANAGGQVLTDYPYLAFSLVTALAWALFAQLGIAVPLYARAVLGLESSIGLLWTITSLTVILLQFSVTRFATRHLTPMRTMALGSLLLGLGLGLIIPAHAFIPLLLAILVFIFGEMLLMPTADAAVSTFAPPAALGSYFGIATVAWGLGDGLGNLLGGALMQYALTTRAYSLPWALYASAGAVIALLFLALSRTPTRSETAPRGIILQYEPTSASRMQEKVGVGPNYSDGDP